MRSPIKFNNDINQLEGNHSERPSSRHRKGKTLLVIYLRRPGLGLAACEGLFRLQANQKEPKAELHKTLEPLAHWCGKRPLSPWSLREVSYRLGSEVVLFQSLTFQNHSIFSAFMDSVQDGTIKITYSDLPWFIPLWSWYLIGYFLVPVSQYSRPGPR